MFPSSFWVYTNEVTDNARAKGSKSDLVITHDKVKQATTINQLTWQGTECIKHLTCTKLYRFYGWFWEALASFKRLFFFSIVWQIIRWCFTNLGKKESSSDAHFDDLGGVALDWSCHQPDHAIVLKFSPENNTFEDSIRCSCCYVYYSDNTWCLTAQLFFLCRFFGI